MDITQEVIDSFRNYPLFNGKFSDCTTWSDDIIESALCIADGETGGAGWGTYQDECHNFKQKGMFLFAACWSIVNYPSGSMSQGFSVGRGGNVSSKSVGDESVSYSTYTPTSLGKAADTWLLTVNPWGSMYISFRRRAGRGCRAL